jgi:hypothetical protein
MIIYAENAKMDSPEPLNLDNISMAVVDPGRFFNLTRFTQDMLTEHYDSVETPIKPPNTHKFGTLEIFVSGRKEPIEDKIEEFEAIASSLHGVLLRHHKDTASVVFSLGPEIEADISIRGESAEEPDSNRHLCYRMDVTVCSSPDEAKWKSFMRNHGDFCNLLGSIIRPFGLVLNDDGFFVSFALDENEDSPETAMFLAAEPSQVLKFLKLSPEVVCDFEFNSLSMMFCHIAKCPLAFSSLSQRQHFSVFTEDSATEISPLVQTDRVLRLWYEMFMPAEMERLDLEPRYIPREKVVNDVLSYFGVADEYRCKQEALANAN